MFSITIIHFSVSIQTDEISLTAEETVRALNLITSAQPTENIAVNVIRLTHPTGETNWVSPRRFELEK